MPVKMKGFDKAIANMEARAKDFRGGKPYEEAGKIASQSIAKNVDSGGRPKWQKRKNDYPHPILDKTGTMRDAAEDTATQWEHGRVWHINKIMGPVYGAVHQYAGVRTKIGNSIKKIVRKYVIFQTTEISAMKQAFRNSFLRK